MEQHVNLVYQRVHNVQTEQHVQYVNWEQIVTLMLIIYVPVFMGIMIKTLL